MSGVQGTHKGHPYGGWGRVMGSAGVSVSEGWIPDYSGMTKKEGE